VLAQSFTFIAIRALTSPRMAMPRLHRRECAGYAAFLTGAASSSFKTRRRILPIGVFGIC
jgi:hypothetical protein